MKKAKRQMISLKNPDEIPELRMEEDARLFWDTHEITEEFLSKSDSVPEEDLPPVAHYCKEKSFKKRK